MRSRIAIRWSRWTCAGHARSESPQDPGLYTQDQVVEDLRAVMDATEVERAVVGGHSLGGYTSMRFYQRYPDRVRGLILSGTGPGYRRMEGARGWTAVNEKDSQKLAARGMDISFDARAEETGRHGGDAPIQHTVRGLVNVRLGVMRMPPLVDCTEIQAPTIHPGGRERCGVPGLVRLHGGQDPQRHGARRGAGGVALGQLRRSGHLERGGGAVSRRACQTSPPRSARSP